MTFAPYLAIRTLLQLASDEEHRFSLGSLAVRKNTYLDDILSGGDSMRSLGEQEPNRNLAYSQRF